MAYPPDSLPSNRSNTTAQFDNHPADHNAIADAIGDIVNELGNNPSIGQATVQAVIQNVIDTKANVGGDTFTGPVTIGTLDVTGTTDLGGDGFTTSGLQVTDEGRTRIRTTQTAAALRVELALDANVNGGVFLAFARGGTTVGSITTPAPETTQYNESSDPRLKENVGAITDAADRVQHIGHTAFRGIWNGDEDRVERDMCNAVNIQEVAPYAVIGQPNAVDTEGNVLAMQVSYTGLVPLLFAALADALDRIDALEA